ncbi:MAG: TA system VapC family ribonuclease toxin [Spirochaetota bacterium]
MTLWDVNIWVYAFRADSPHHEQAYGIIAGALERGSAYLLYPFVAASFLRLVTNTRIFREPSEPAEAWRFADHLETANGAHALPFDRQAHALFRHLGLTTNAAGNAVPDAMIAAAAMRYDAELVTGDEGFRQYAGLKLRVVD